MHGQPQDGQFWGKYDKNTDTWHPLIAHCADVAAVAVALLERTLLGRRLARLAGRDALPPVWIARLGWLAAIHDFGKVNHAFRNKIRADNKGFGGHVKVAWDLLWNTGPEPGRLKRLLEFVEKRTWFDDTAAFWAAFGATICHHGRAYPEKQPQPDRKPWQRAAGVDPLAEVERLVAAADRWFPEAFVDDGEPLPSGSDFWHAWNGLLTLADWLGSTPNFFPFTDDADADRMPEARRLAERALSIVGLDVDDPRARLGGSPPTFERLVGRPFAPRPSQAATGALPADPAGTLSVLEAPTGEGKSEAALWRFLTLFAAGEVDGLYFALPTRTAATQIYRRVCAIIERVFDDPEARPAVVQAVPGYVSADGVEATRLGPFEVLWPDDEEARHQHRAWAAEAPKRYLAAPIAIGTIDQVLLSTLRVRHAHLRATPLLRQLLVVDEVHASDVYMTRLLHFVLDHHRRAGGHALLMSATLGGAARSSLLGVPVRPSLDECLAVPYPALTHRPHGQPIEMQGLGAAAERARSVAIDLRPSLDDPEAIAARALDAAERGARVLVIRNTVGAATETQLALERLATERRLADRLFAIETERGPVPTLHHSRFARVDRERLDAAIERAFDPSREQLVGRVAVATQTVQQSLDLCADFMLSDLCPLDVLLQRIGRLHRHDGPPRPEGFGTPRCIVLVPTSRSIQELAEKPVHGLGSVYPDLRIIEATWRELETRDAVRVPEDCRELVERTTHPEALETVADQLTDHERQVIGKTLLDKQLATANAVEWSEPFPNATLGDTHEAIRTRHGDDDVRVCFADDETVSSAFDAIVRDLTLRRFQLPETFEVKPDNKAEVLAIEPALVRFRFAGRTFVYDRLGIRPEP